ncbi:MAG: AAA family ATPase [Flavobacteriales bacterium]|nr:MAG: AAA family ATPase [Flavobacteriales bacterium]
MIQKVTIKNFKRFDEAEIELGSPVIFVGPNNAGKTTALQALALWDLGLKTWSAKRSEKSVAKTRAGVVVSRRDLVQLPVPDMGMLWKDLHLRQVPKGDQKRATQKVHIEITVEGVTNGKEWFCALEFDHANDEYIHCRPSKRHLNAKDKWEIPDEALEIDVAYLPPMSGLESNERKIDEGAITVSLGQGKTADVLRNLCYQVWMKERDEMGKGEWPNLVAQMRRLFGIRLLDPEYNAARGEISMSYVDEVTPGQRKQASLDLSAAGRGLQQTLLLLTFLRWRPKSVLLIDEPDAHLEILRQSQIYRELSSTADALGSQLVLATHSEVVLREAEDSRIVAFIGKPHTVRQTKELRKALNEIGFDQFIQAEITGWVLYLEGSTDLTALRNLAAIAYPEALPALDRPFHHYVLNQTDKAQRHFSGLREAHPQLAGIAVFDNSPDVRIQANSPLTMLQWQRRELENYFCTPGLLMRWVERSVKVKDLFDQGELLKRQEAMHAAIADNTTPAVLRDPDHAFWLTTKVSDDYLPQVFKSFFEKLGLPVSMNKSDYAALANLLEPTEVDQEIVEVLKRITEVAHNAKKP